MARYLLGRLAAAVPTLVLLTLAAFLLNLAAKGDPALLALKAGGQDPTPEAIAAYRVKLGLNDPLPVRYVTWVGNVLQGDFGRSSLDGRRRDHDPARADRPDAPARYLGVRCRGDGRYLARDYARARSRTRRSISPAASPACSSPRSRPSGWRCS